MNNENIFKNHNAQLTDTQDMGLAIALLTKGYQLVNLETKDYSKRVTFQFKKEPAIDQIAQSYWAGKLLVDAKLYWSESKNLKTRLYSL
jgi:hypothetical protein